MSDPTPPPGQRSREPRRPRLGPRGLVLLVVLAVVSCELVLRYGYGFGNPRVVETSARVGYRFHPNQTVPGPHGTSERINGHGYRDLDRSEAAAGGAVPRIVVLGTSISYGSGVADDDVWPRLFERELRRDEGRDGGRTYEVRNMAIPGYVLEQFVHQYEDDVRPLAPELVILELSPYAALSAPAREDEARYPFHTLVKRSAIYDALRRREGPHPFLARRGQLALRDPELELDPELLAAARERMSALADLVRADGARLVVLESPALGNVLAPADGPDLWRAWAAGREEVVHVPTREVLCAELAGLLAELERRGIEPRRVWSRFGRRAELETREPALFFRDDPWHLDESGHELVARIVLEALREAGLL